LSNHKVKISRFQKKSQKRLIFATVFFITDVLQARKKGIRWVPFSLISGE
jgi:hypothetical protein